MTNEHSNKDNSCKERFISELNRDVYSSMDAIAYEERASGRHRFFEENIAIIDGIIKMIYENTEGEKCLDVGVGSGLVLLREAKYFPECIGLDVSLKMALQKGIPKSMLVEGNCYELPFNDEEFDLVSAYSLLHHLQNIPKFFAEAYRVLKKGGYLYTDGDINIYCTKLRRRFEMARCWVGGKKYRSKYEYWRDILIHTDKEEYYDMGLDIIELERMLKKAGFNKVIPVPRFSVNPIYNKKLTFRIMKKVFHCFKLKSCFTHIQLFAVK